ncbi:hypothetical protein WA158_003677 [Blastocystis sp. Blastoise]
MAPPKTKKRKTKDGSNPRPNSSLYIGYVDDQESIEDIMKKFEVLEQIQKEKTTTNDDESDKKSDNTPLNEKDLEEVFKKTSSFSVEAVLDDSYYLENMIDDESYNSTDDEWDESYAFEPSCVNDNYIPHSYSHVSTSFMNQSRDGTWKDKIRDITAQALNVICYEIDDNNNMTKYSNNPFPNDIEVIKVPKDIPQTWCTPIRPYTSHEPLLPPLSTHITTEDICSYSFSSLKQTFEGILINPPWDHVTPQDIANLSFPSSVIPTGMIFIWVDKKYIHDILLIMEKKNFYYVENVNWMDKEPNNVFHSSDSSTLFRSGKRTMLLFRRGKRRNFSSAVEFLPLQLRHQRTTDVYIGSKPQEQYKQYSNGIEFIYGLIETLLPEGNFSEITNRGKFLELWGQKGYTRKGWTIISEEKEESN